MGLSLFTFVLVLAIVVGAYWVFILRPENLAQAKVKKRLHKPKDTRAARLALLKEPERLSDVAALNAVLSRVSAVSVPLQRLILQSGLRLTLGTLLLATGCAASLAFLLAHYATAQLVLALIAAVLAGLAPVAYIRYVRTRRLLKFEEQFPEAIDLLARALRAGHAFSTGLSMIAEEIPEPVGAEFRLLFDHQNYGMSLPDALKNFADRVPILDARFFVTAVLTQREAGGNLAEVLDNLSAIIRDRFRIKRQVRVVSAHGRITGWILAMLPPALALMFVILTPDNYRKFYSDPIGVQMIAFAVLLQIAGVVIIRRIVNIEY